MRKIHEIFAPQKELPKEVTHWTRVHGNLLLKTPNRKFLKGFILSLVGHVRGAGTKRYPEKKTLRVYFDRSFLVAKFFTVINQFHLQRFSKEEIKKLVLEALEVFYSELENQSEGDQDDTSD